MHSYTLLAELTGLDVALLFAGAILLVIATATAMWFLQKTRRAQYDKELAAQRAAAEAEAQKIVAQAEAKAKTEFIARREQFDRETDETRKELRAEEKRLAKREDLVDQKLDTLNTKERMLEAAQRAVAEKEKSLANKDRQLNELIAQQKTQLLKVANLTMEDARAQLMSRVEKELAKESAQLIGRRLEEAQETAEGQAREIIVTAIQRYAAEHTCETTVSTVPIPSDDMKGRVIGR